MPSKQEIDAKRKIELALRSFQSGSLRANAIAFFDALGYRSSKSDELEPNTPQGLLALVNRSDFLNPYRAQALEWQSVDFLFQLTDEDIRELGETTVAFGSKASSTLTDKQIDSYIFFALELKAGPYSRTQLADITREINRLFPMPALVMFKHGDTLTLAIINRRIHKKDAARDVLEKVTLIKDIRCDSPHRGHTEILYDLAFPQLTSKYEVTNFIQLDDAWRKALDSSTLNERFYRDLAYWYYWALGQVEFPKQEGVADDVNRATNVIRLITRFIFVWFLRELDLVPTALLDRNELSEVLKDLSNDKSTFYKAILQNLFFATLNMPIDDPKLPRRFRGKAKTERGYDQHAGISNVYRYEDYFRGGGTVAIRLFESIPFLNGGLFECLDKDEKQEGETWKQTRLRGLIDGFSELPENPLSVPNRLFFCEEHEALDDGINLNEIFGTNNKTFKVRGLIDILERYKFTIAENTPIEEEVALDPELLGKVFENLLASYNPETGTTARNQTGSFYTPREIVNYMVDESLIAYLVRYMTSELNGLEHSELNEHLRQLLSYTHESHKFSESEVERLIEAIDAVKILDPACGSGAFPMGMLHKLVFILQKLDVSGDLWRERQRQRAIQETEEAFNIGNQSERDERLREISDIFQRNSTDYGRKLFLIENCIYGVDIQPIAIQIAKLRFFISLIIDQTIQADVKNLGITPLPNLETKLVAANSLLGLESGTRTLKPERINELEGDLKEVRSKIFRARRPSTKAKWRTEDKRIRGDIAQLLKESGFPPGSADRIAEWQPDNQDSSVDWFESEWMFGIADGFDVVIGNPPYLSALEYAKCYPNHDRRELYKGFQSAKGSYDIYVLFYERGIKLLNNLGELIFISPNKLLSARYAVALREFIVNNATITSVVDVSGIKVFKEASVYPVIFSVNRQTIPKNKVKLVLPRNRLVERFEVRSFFLREADSDTLRLLPENIWGFLLSDNLPLLIKMMAGSKPLLYFGKINASSTAAEADEYGSYITEKKTDDSLKIINTGTIERYSSLWGEAQLTNARRKFLKPYLPLKKAGVNNRRRSLYTTPKIVFAKMAKVFEGFLDSKGEFASINTNCFYEPVNDIDIRYVAGFCNSSLFMFLYQQFFGALRMSGGYFQFQAPQLRVIPLKKPSNSSSKAVVSLVDEILAAKSRNARADTSKLEREIDRVLYELYELTPEEQAIIEAPIGEEEAE